ncbi:MAG: PilZ domain-containing protein [Spirochaetales bacterium]|jgi:hypothetical protein|nr:PilZ domain-containing protein [Spirochaetales bacterium]
MKTIKTIVRPKRVPIQHTVHFNDREFSISNLSPGGCYVAGKLGGDWAPDSGLFQIEGAHGFELRCDARVVWVSGGGFGIEFLGLSREDRRQLKRLIANRYNYRYVVALPASWQSGGWMQTGVVHDLSKSGCYIATHNAHVVTGQPGRVQFRIPGHKKTIPGRVVWKNLHNDYDKPTGFGIEFDRKRGRVLRHFMLRHGKVRLAR